MRFSEKDDMLSFRRSIPMKETNIKNAKTAVTITTVLNFFAAGFEVIMAFILFDVVDFKSLIMSSENLKTLWIKLLEEGVRYKMYRENGFLVENATERYLHFRRLFPKLCERVPQKHIATYLGITPESLSRIRKAMKEEELF